MLILLVHGLGRTPLSLFGLAAALRRAGHRTRFFGYSPTIESLQRICERLRNRLRALTRSCRPVGLVGHSLGGLLLCHAIALVPELRVHRLIMLGTPLRGSLMARRASRWLAFRLFTRDCGRFLASTPEVGIFSNPAVPYTIIAGTGGPCGSWSPFGNLPNDGVVSVSETALENTEATQFPVIHTIIMDSPQVRSRILAAFENER